MKKNRFINPHSDELHRNLWDVVLWKIGYYNEKRERPPMPSSFAYPAKSQSFDPQKPSALWIGHSTYLIQIGGVSILTDPVWNSYCSPIPVKALKRIHEPAIALTDLPKIDFVLLSHNHYDHLDAKTVETLHHLQPQIKWIVPLGVAAWFHKRNIQTTIELDWWKSTESKNCKITAVPTQHFSGRTLWDMNQTLWNGYVFESQNKRLYFVGDTGYNSKDFKQIGQHWEKMDLSLIPIGTYVPQIFMKPVHISPYEAVQIHEDVKSHFSLGMHWNTFRLSDEPLERPPFDLYLAMKEKGFPFETFLPIEIGRYVNW